MAEPTQNLRSEPLGERLRSLEADEVFLTLREIEQLIGGRLPSGASTHQFWANTRHHLSRRAQWLDNGFEAFFEAKIPGVRFTRRQRPKGEPWSSDELEACVRAYHGMMLLQSQGSSFSKAQWRRTVLPELSNRTEASYEFRMQNISAVLSDLGLPVLSGYLPARNVGNVRDEIIRLINIYWNRQEEEAPTDDQEKLETRVVSARQKLVHNPARVPKGKDRPQRSAISSTSFVRDPEVMGWVLNLAKGICEMCAQAAPFVKRDGEPYLEVHHLRQLAEGGPDQVDNALALCPNCHRNFHHGREKGALRRAALQSVGRLRDYPEIKADAAAQGEP